MNERIKLLAEQAGGEFYEGFAGSTNFVKFAENDFEKFAEMIVRECIDKIETHRIPVGNSAAGEMACEWTYSALKEIRDEIKEHFGVKRMNERIEKLVEQAGYTKGHHDEYGRLTVMPEFNKEKFAELIVRECMKESMEEIVADEDIAQEKDPLIREYLLGNNQGIVDAVIRFRNYFGVEE